MGGTLQVESEVGRGSRFVVELPVELATESETYGGEGFRVRFIPSFLNLAVQPGMARSDCRRRTLKAPRSCKGKMLTLAGFQVSVAENGALGVDAFLRWRPHFIWMDLGLPQLSGMEATRRIRQLDGGAAAKIAAITATASASERDAVLRRGFDDCTFKPFRRTEILSCMARHLGVRYSTSEGARNKSRGKAKGLHA